MLLRQEILAAAEELGVRISDEERADIEAALSISYEPSGYEEAAMGIESGVLHYPVLFDDDRERPAAFYQHPRNLVTNWKAVFFDVGPTAGLGAATIASNPWLTPFVALAVAWKLKGHSLKRLSSAHAKVVWAIHSKSGHATDAEVLDIIKENSWLDERIKTLDDVNIAIDELDRVGIIAIRNGVSILRTTIRIPPS